MTTKATLKSLTTGVLARGEVAAGGDGAGVVGTGIPASVGQVRAARPVAPTPLR